MPTPPLALDGPDLTVPDEASRFRQLLLDDVDALLKEHHARMAQHVEENLEDLYLRLSRQTPKAVFGLPADKRTFQEIRSTLSAGRENSVGNTASAAKADRDTEKGSKALRSFSHSMMLKMQTARDYQMREDTIDEDEEDEDFDRKARLRNAFYGNDSALKSFVQSTVFESVTCLLIVSNAIFFGVETQCLSMQIRPEAFSTITFCYTVVFTVELLLRFVVDPKGFYCGNQRMWSFVDTFVVAASLLELSFEMSDAASNVNLTYIRIIRVARAVRIFRVVRILQAFSSLRILLYCVLNTLRSLIWTIVLLLIILYVFGILFTQAANEALTADRGALDAVDQKSYDSLKRYYGSLMLSIRTLFKAVTGGVNWQDVSDPLGFVQPFWEIVFIAFISFTYFAVLNVVTGVFCQSAIESANHDKDMVVQAQLSNKRLYTEQLRDLFGCIDSQNKGTVNFSMLENCLDNQQCQAYFDALGITSDDAWNLFKLLDGDDSNQIDLEEFVSGCLRLRGSARSIDSHMLLYESRWTMKKVSALNAAFNELLLHLCMMSPELSAEPLEVQTPPHVHNSSMRETLRKQYEESHVKMPRPSGAHGYEAAREASSGESTIDSPDPHRQKEADCEEASASRASNKQVSFDLAAHGSMGL